MADGFDWVVEFDGFGPEFSAVFFAESCYVEGVGGCWGCFLLFLD